MSISCAQYDQLELAAMRGQLLRLIFINGVDERSQVEGKIKNLYVCKGKEYVLMSDEQELLLDELVTIETL